jgi:nucleotide-binding universal stress UspA family protein
MSFRRIVLAVNGSTSSTQATQRAIELALEDSDLTVIGVDEPVPAHAFRVRADANNGHIEAIVEEAVAQARQAGVRALGEVRHGYPAEVLVKFSEEAQCDLLVLGGGSPGTLRLGRTVDKVVDLASGAVLVVR